VQEESSKGGIPGFVHLRTGGGPSTIEVDTSAVAEARAAEPPDPAQRLTDFRVSYRWARLASLSAYNHLPERRYWEYRHEVFRVGRSRTRQRV
jgi:hypothetical protein